MKNIKKVTSTIIMILTLVLFVSGISYAASDKTTSGDGDSSYTRKMGASPTATFNYMINYANGGYKAQIMDPYLWHTVAEQSLLHKGASGSFRRNEGSAGAYWRGWVKSGWIRVTV